MSSFPNRFVWRLTLVALVAALALSVASASVTDGTPDPEFSTNIGTGFTGPGFSGQVFAVAVQTDGKIVVGGTFTTFNGVVANHIARLNADGTADVSFAYNVGTGFSDVVSSIAIQSDGKIVVGGDFGTLNNVPFVFRVARLNADGTPDTAFSTKLGISFNKAVNAVAVQADGKIVVGGAFDTGGSLTNGIARLNADGSQDATFAANVGSGFNGSVSSLAVQSDGRIVAGGAFTTLNGVAHRHVARMNATGTPDATFTGGIGTGFGFSVLSVAVQSDGKIVVGGNFSVANGATNRLTRLNTDGSPDSAFITTLGSGFNNDVSSVAIQGDGQIVVIGIFGSLNGSALGSGNGGVARLNTNGTLDTAFNANLGTGFDNTGVPYAGAVQGASKIIVGGDFTRANGVSSVGLVRLGFDDGVFTLRVALSGSGAGAVRSSPAGIDCATNLGLGATDCSEPFAQGTVVTLTAAADVASKFVSWSAGGCGTNPVCTVSITGALTLTATFQPPVTLAISKGGPGTVTSSPAGIQCGTTCSAVFGKGAVVTLTATPDAGARLLNWGLACPVGPTCQVTVMADMGLVATFAQFPPAITTVTPSVGTTRGGTKVTLHGSGFTSASNVTIGESDGFGVLVSADQTTLTFVAPPLSLGAKAITIRNNDAQTTTMNNAFTVVAAAARNPDLNHDGEVDIFDATILTGCLGVAPTPGTSCWDADLDDSGAVDRADLDLLREAYGQTGISTAGTMTVRGASASTFNPVGATIWFDVTSGTINPQGGVVVIRNDVPVAPSALHADATSIRVDGALVEGRNHFEVIAAGISGQDYFLEVTLWAGSHTIQGALTGELAPLVGAMVTATIGDDKEATSWTSALGPFGSFTLNNVPALSVAITVRTADNRVVSTAVPGDIGIVLLKMAAVMPPSQIDNNDLHLGTTAGWAGDGVISIQPHIEAKGRAGIAVNVVDNDIAVKTLGMGSRHITRTFAVKPGTKSITVRFRFSTTEFPDFFGSKFDDCYSVTLTTTIANGYVNETRSMNSLGASAFDPFGQTVWRELTIPVTADGEIAELEAVVTNVSDGQYDSSIIVDSIVEHQILIRDAALTDIDDSGLSYLSVGPHDHLDGETPIHGRIKIDGPNGDSLTGLSLEISWQGQVVETLELDEDAAEVLLKPFGAMGRVEIEDELLFTLTQEQAIQILHDQDGDLELNLVATTALGDQARVTFRHVGLLVSVATSGTGEPTLPRFGANRDEDKGGDDWGRPSLRRFARGFPTLKWNDFSNINGGSFEPDHHSHQRGNDVDVQFADGFEALDPEEGCFASDVEDIQMAKRFLDLLNDIVHGEEIQFIWVTCRDKTTEFWKTLEGKKVLGNRDATTVIQHLRKHDDHFHVRILEKD